jgi:hypothetical protein
MKTWELLCVNRETGAESHERIHAATEQAAMSVAADRGLMVAKIKLHRSDETPPLPPVPADWKYHVGDHSGTVLLYLGGATLAVLGMFGIGVGLGMDTTVASAGDFGIAARTHNIGLLNMQTCTVIAGSALFLGGVILLGVARIVGQLFRYGRPTVAYLLAMRGHG